MVFLKPGRRQFQPPIHRREGSPKPRYFVGIGIRTGIGGVVLLLQNPNIRKIPIRLAIVESIANHEEILDLGAEERDVNLNLAP